MIIDIIEHRWRGNAPSAALKRLHNFTIPPAPNLHQSGHSAPTPQSSEQAEMQRWKRLVGSELGALHRLDVMVQDHEKFRVVPLVDVIHVPQPGGTDLGRSSVKPKPSW